MRLNDDVAKLLNHSGPSQEAVAMDRLQEQVWVLGAQKGDEKAFEGLVTRYERQLLYYLTHFTNDPWQSADALQDVWVTVFRGLKRLRAPEAFRVWLYQVAHNRVMTLLRRRSFETEAKEALQDEQNVSASMNEPEFVDAELVHQALAQIAPLHREVLVLRFLRDLSLEEIAQVMGVSVGTVKSRLHYAKQVIKRQLEEHIHEDRE
jgi:RNA polymerase sigma-70 factor (ECF subfamily)